MPDRCRPTDAIASQRPNFAAKLPIGPELGKPLGPGLGIPQFDLVPQEGDRGVPRLPVSGANLRAAAPLPKQFQMDRMLEELLARVVELERGHETLVSSCERVSEVVLGIEQSGRETVASRFGETQRFGATPGSEDSSEIFISETQFDALIGKWQSRVEELELENADLTAQAKGNIHKQVAETLAMELETLRNELQTQRSQNAELQQRNVELTKRIQNNSAGDSGASTSADGLSWEEMKQSWLAKLEEEACDDGNGASAARLLEIQGVIEATNAEIDRRDLEIAELRHVLSEQAVATQGIAVGAAAIAAQLNQDDFIREERERLQVQQEVWEQKQRQAEVEMSLERARLARERLELLDTMQTFEAIQLDFRKRSSDGSEENADIEAKPRGRWLKKLGLQER